MASFSERQARGYVFVDGKLQSFSLRALLCVIGLTSSLGCRASSCSGTSGTSNTKDVSLPFGLSFPPDHQLGRGILDDGSYLIQNSQAPPSASGTLARSHWMDGISLRRLRQLSVECLVRHLTLRKRQG